jgi:hypothetical protein
VVIPRMRDFNNHNLPLRRFTPFSLSAFFALSLCNLLTLLISA